MKLKDVAEVFRGKSILKNDNLVGSGGFETLTFKAVSGGSATIILTYNRPREKDVQPEKIFKLNTKLNTLVQ